MGGGEGGGEGGEGTVRQEGGSNATQGFVMAALRKTQSDNLFYVAHMGWQDINSFLQNFKSGAITEFIKVSLGLDWTGSWCSRLSLVVVCCHW